MQQQRKPKVGTHQGSKSLGATTTGKHQISIPQLRSQILFGNVEQQDRKRNKNERVDEASVLQPTPLRNQGQMPSHPSHQSRANASYGLRRPQGDIMGTLNMTQATIQNTTPPNQINNNNKSRQQKTKQIIVDESNSPNKTNESMMTSFQNYIIAKNSSPLSKMQDRHTPSPERPQVNSFIQQQPQPSKPLQYLNETIQKQEMPLSRATFYKNENNVLENTSLQIGEEDDLLKTIMQNGAKRSQTVIGQQSQNAHQASPQKMTRKDSHALFYEVPANQMQRQDQESFQSPLRNTHLLCENNTKSSEDKKQRSGRRQPCQATPNQQPIANLPQHQNSSNLLGSSLVPLGSGMAKQIIQQQSQSPQRQPVAQTAQNTNNGQKYQQQQFNSFGAITPFNQYQQQYALQSPVNISQVRASSQTAAGQLNHSFAAANNNNNNSNLVDDSWHSQFQTGNFQQNSAMPATSQMSGAELLQYYQQKFNLIQQAAAQIQAQQRSLQQPSITPSKPLIIPPLQLQQPIQLPQQYPLYGKTSTPQPPLPIQTFQTFDNLINQPCTPVSKLRASMPLPQENMKASMVQPSNASSPPRQQRCTSKAVNSSAGDGGCGPLEELYKVLNRRVVHDFESQPLNQIKSKVTNDKGIVNSSSNQLDAFIAGQISKASYQEQNVRSSIHRPKQIPISNEMRLQNAAVHVQKYLKGFIIRKRFNCFAKLFFMFKRYQKKVVAKEIAQVLRDSFVCVKTIRKRMLEVYVNKCATKIQKMFRGWFLRQRVQPLHIRRAFYQISMAGKREVLLNKVRAVVKGWRVRRIMSTKEIANYVRQIKDYQDAYFDIKNAAGGETQATSLGRRQQLMNSLLMSRTGTIVKMIGLINKLQERGLWLKYARANTDDSILSMSKSQLSKSAEKRPTKSVTNNQAAGKPSVRKEETVTGRRRVTALSHSKPATSQPVSKYVTIEQPRVKVNQQNNVAIKQTFESSSFNSAAQESFNYQPIGGRKSQQTISMAAMMANLSPTQSKPIVVYNEGNIVQRGTNSQNISAQNNNKLTTIASVLTGQGGSQLSLPGENSSQPKLQQSKTVDNPSKVIDFDNMPIPTHQKRAHITTYDEVPIMSGSLKNANNNSQSTYNVQKCRFEPNFQSNAYKEQAKQIFKRRMCYNPREAASKSRERGNQNRSQVNHSALDNHYDQQIDGRNNSPLKNQARASTFDHVVQTRQQQLINKYINREIPKEQEPQYPSQTIQQQTQLQRNPSPYINSQQQQNTSTNRLTYQQQYRLEQQPSNKSLAGVESLYSQPSSSPTHGAQRVSSTNNAVINVYQQNSNQSKQVDYKASTQKYQEVREETKESNDAIDQQVQQIMQEMNIDQTVKAAATNKSYSRAAQAQMPIIEETPSQKSLKLVVQSSPQNSHFITSNKTQSDTSLLYQRTATPKDTYQRSSYIPGINSSTQIYKEMTAATATKSPATYQASNNQPMVVNNNSTVILDQHMSPVSFNNYSSKKSSNRRRTREERKKEVKYGIAASSSSSSSNIAMVTGKPLDRQQPQTTKARDSSQLQYNQRNYGTNNNYHQQRGYNQSPQQVVDPDISMFDHSQKLQVSNRQTVNDTTDKYHYPERSGGLSSQNAQQQTSYTTKHSQTINSGAATRKSESLFKKTYTGYRR